MSTSDFPVAGADTEMSSRSEVDDSASLLLRNSRLLCWITMSGSVIAAVMAICMVLMVAYEVFVANGGFAERAFGLLRWGVCALAMGVMCPRLWKLGQAMAGYQVVLNGDGVSFNLGTEEDPAELFLAWDQISSIQCERAGNASQIIVEGKDGSVARFSSDSFFHPMKIACMIAERAGLAIENV